MPEGHKSWITDWRPEDAEFWEARGKKIARRNLIWSIAAEHLGFSIWLIRSIVATRLPQAGFPYTTDQLRQLVALPGLIGALMAFLQLYREEARCRERTAPWVSRVGIDDIRRRIVDDVESRRALHRRFLFAQRFVQNDPWAERAAGAAAHEYRALSLVAPTGVE